MPQLLRLLMEVVVKRLLVLAEGDGWVRRRDVKDGVICISGSVSASGGGRRGHAEREPGMEYRSG